MISGRRFLRAAALAAVLALAFAGSAMAKTTTWQGGDGNWSGAGKWDKGIPGADDTAIIPSGTVTVDVEAKAEFVQLGENATLRIAHGKKLTLSAGGRLYASGNAKVVVVPDEGLTFTNTNNIAVDAGKTLSLEGAGFAQGVADALTLSGGGTLVLEVPIKTANELTLKNGSTLVASVNCALPDVAKVSDGGTEAGNIVVEGTDLFKKTLTSLRMNKGNLTLKTSLRPELKKITMVEGILTVHDGAQFGGGADAELELGQDSSLDLRGDLTLGALKTHAGGAGAIAVTEGKTLTLKKSAGAATNFSIPVTGRLRLEVDGVGHSFALQDKTEWVTLAGNAANLPELSLESDKGPGMLQLEGGVGDRLEVIAGDQDDLTVGALICPKLKECLIHFSNFKKTLTVGALEIAKGAEVIIESLAGAPGTLALDAVEHSGHQDGNGAGCHRHGEEDVESPLPLQGFTRAGCFP